MSTFSVEYKAILGMFGIEDIQVFYQSPSQNGIVSLPRPFSRGDYGVFVPNSESYPSRHVGGLIPFNSFGKTLNFKGDTEKFQTCRFSTWDPNQLIPFNSFGKTLNFKGDTEKFQTCRFSTWDPNQHDPDVNIASSPSYTSITYAAKKLVFLCILPLE